jgi:hypothetical protein
MRIGNITNLIFSHLLALNVTLFLVALLLAACSGASSEQMKATVEAQEALTTTYGIEVQSIIENFQAKWQSIDAHKNSSIQANLATGPYLDYWGYARMGKGIYDEPFWLTTRSVEIKNLQVIEHGPERIKAVARVVTLSDKITPAGKFIQSNLSSESCGLYVFVRKDNLWKLAAGFDMTRPQDVERDWAREPDWSKQLIGDLPPDACD